MRDRLSLGLKYSASRQWLASARVYFRDEAEFESLRLLNMEAAKITLLVVFFEALNGPSGGVDGTFLTALSVPQEQKVAALCSLVVCVAFDPVS